MTMHSSGSIERTWPVALSITTWLKSAIFAILGGAVSYFGYPTTIIQPVMDEATFEILELMMPMFCVQACPFLADSLPEE